MASASPLRVASGVVSLGEWQISGIEDAGPSAGGTAAGIVAPLGLCHIQAGAGAGLWDAAH